MTGTLYSKEELTASAAILVVLGSPEALQIVQYYQNSMLSYLAAPTVNEIAEATGLDIPIVGAKLAMLANAGVLISAVEAPNNYRLNPNMPELAQDVLLALWPL